MVTREILNSHPLSTLKKEVSKYNKLVSVSGYSKMKKAQVVELMMKNTDKFKHIKKNEKAPKKEKPVPAPRTQGAKPATPKAKKRMVKKAEPKKEKPVPAPRKKVEPKKEKPVPEKKEELTEKEAKDIIFDYRRELGKVRDSIFNITKLKKNFKTKKEMNDYLNTKKEEVNKINKDYEVRIKKIENMKDKSEGLKSRLGGINSSIMDVLKSLKSRAKKIAEIQKN